MYLAKNYPIQKKYHRPDYLRTIPHLRLRTPHNATLARVRSESEFSFANFFHSRQFVRLHPPIITSSDCEGAGEVFGVESDSSPSRLDAKSDSDYPLFFKSPKYLTVSAQLHLEAFVHEHAKVWTLSPTFRAEKSDTPRHLSEFLMLEAELRTERLEELMDIVEELIRDLVLGLQGSHLIEELTFADTKVFAGNDAIMRAPISLRERSQSLIGLPWPRVTYTQAVDTLREAVESKQEDFQYEPSWENGLQLEHERYLASKLGRGGPVFVTHYPQSLKPFYMLPSPDNQGNGSGRGATVACFDLLLPEACEIVGGSLREHRLDHLTRSMRSHGLSTASSMAEGDSLGKTSAAVPGNLDWYLDLRRYGSVPHGGFGLGFDRLIGYLTGMNNIKDVVPWPRYHGRCDC